MNKEYRNRTSLVAAAAVVALIAILNISSPAVSQQAAAPTFTKDVASIFQEKCQSCHRPGYIAPMSLSPTKRHGPGRRQSKSESLRGRCPRGTWTNLSAF